jgi:hypothetical protein
MFMVLLKLDRMNNIVQYNKTPKNESITDSVKDAHNYLDLGYGIVAEENNNHSKKGANNG